MSFDDRFTSYLRRTRQLVTAELEAILAEYDAAGRGDEPLPIGIRSILAEWRQLAAASATPDGVGEADTAA